MNWLWCVTDATASLPEIVRNIYSLSHCYTPESAKILWKTRWKVVPSDADRPNHSSATPSWWCSTAGSLKPIPLFGIYLTEVASIGSSSTIYIYNVQTQVRMIFRDLRASKMWARSRGSSFWRIRSVEIRILILTCLTSVNSSVTETSCGHNVMWIIDSNFMQLKFQKERWQCYGESFPTWSLSREFVGPSVQIAVMTGVAGWGC
jgi:hypothetical protein